MRQLLLVVALSVPIFAMAQKPVPSCQDKQVQTVLSNAFKQQGQATNTPMQVKKIRQIKETQYYEKNQIRGCHAVVETIGRTYETDYSIIVNNEGFYVQVENALPR